MRGKKEKDQIGLIRLPSFVSQEKTKYLSYSALNFQSNINENISDIERYVDI